MTLTDYSHSQQVKQFRLDIVLPDAYDLFDTHIIRDFRSLDGVWKFKMDGVDKDYTLPVPGYWEQHPDFMNHQGTGRYTKSVYVKKQTRKWQQQIAVINMLASYKKKGDKNGKE